MPRVVTASALALLFLAVGSAQTPQALRPRPRRPRPGREDGAPAIRLPRRARPARAGSVQEDGDPQRHPHRRHRRPAAQPDGHRHRGQPHHARCGRPAGRGCRNSRTASRATPTSKSTARDVRDARLRGHARSRLDAGKAPDLSYSYKLWLAHGVTTVRGVSLSSAEVTSSEKDRSAKNEIVAPRIFNYQTLGSGWTGGRSRRPRRRASG